MRVRELPIVTKEANYSTVQYTKVQSTVYIDLDSIVCIDKGEWDDNIQDWYSVLGYYTGVKREVAVPLKEMIKMWMEGGKKDERMQPNGE